MKYLFFDTECANCYTGKGKIYSFGCITTDENFQIICPLEDMLINPKSSFDPYVRKNILAYDRTIFKTLPDFSVFYPEICKRMCADDTLCFGYGVDNDKRYLSDDCKRYGLPKIVARVFDVQKIIVLAEGKPAKKLSAEYVERFGEVETGNHKSDVDAIRTMNIARDVCMKTGKKLHEFFS